MTNKTAKPSSEGKTTNKRKIVLFVVAYVLFSAIVATSIGMIVGRELKDNDQPTTSRRNPQPHTNKQQDTKLHGIVIANTSNKEWRLDTYNVKGQIQHTRTFTFDGYNTGRLWSAISGPDGPVMRQLFNADFTQLAVEQGKSDGGRDVGFVDANGNFTNLTPQASTYGNIIKQTDPMFHPVTGRLWFNTPTKMGSVDPNKGPSSSKEESYSTFTGEVFGSGTTASAFYFSPGGKPLDTEPGLTWAYDLTIYSAGDKHKASYNRGAYDTWGLYYQDSGIKIDDGEVIPFADSSKDSERCWPERFVNDNTFLCRSADFKQIFSVSISGKKFTPLLPVSERTVKDTVADPSGKQIAFIATTGDTSSLYIMPTTGGEPKEITQVAEGSVILSWER